MGGIRKNKMRKFPNLKRIVVKVGTHLLTDRNGFLNRDYIKNLSFQLSFLKKENRDIVLVTSGAIRAGAEKLAISKLLKTIPEKQAAAAVGQGLLMNEYTNAFKKYNQIVAQVLLTKEDIIERKKYLNARNTFFTLFKYNVIPIVNENDTVATEEIQFGDNDTLSALVALLVEADLLIILSDVEGLFTSDPNIFKDAKIIKEVREITPQIKKIAGKTKKIGATGGMQTKIQAAEIVTHSGISLIIADGREKDILKRIISGEEVGTLFLAHHKKLSSRKCWIAFTLPPAGEIYVNEGAKEMLIKGKSLLPIGIIKVSGSFQKGESVRIIDENKKEFARGLTNYSSKEIDLIKGKKTKEIFSILGYKFEDEVIHADNLCIIE
jgi:glutamate 5-kinase